MRPITLLLLVLIVSVGCESVPPEGRDSGLTQSTPGWIHRGCVEFRDPEDVVSKGPITWVRVFYSGYIHGLQLAYDGHAGFVFGFQNFKDAYVKVIPGDFPVPPGERIMRVKGEIAENDRGFLYVNRLQFITDKGTTSPWFGYNRGTPFEVADPNRLLPLRTISGWFNPRRHKDLNRAIASMTFHFSPYVPAEDGPTKPEDRDLGPTEITRTGSIHPGCNEFRDREDLVSKGPITFVKVRHHECIHGLQLYYCGYEGGRHTLGEAAEKGMPDGEWIVPLCERIVRVKGKISTYVTGLQFITDKGTRSPWFGKNRGTLFEVADPNRLPLRTISGWFTTAMFPAPGSRWPARTTSDRVITSMTFHFGPYYEPDEPVDDQMKVEYLRRYAPQVWFHPKEPYWPSSVEWSFHFLKRNWLADRWWFETKEALPEPSSVLPYFHGADPKKQWTDFPLKLEDVPAYAFWHQDPVYPDTVDLVYFFYYPYNRGKSVANTRWGNHVGDWEHVTVRLTARRDSQGRTIWAPSGDPQKASFNLAYHSGDARYPWVKVPKVQDTEHPIIYSAHESHGSWLEPGRHKYDRAVLTDLVDYTGAGTAWDTWKKLECFDYDAKTGLGPTWKGTWPRWLDRDTMDKNLGNEDPASGPVWRWGNYRMGRWFGYYRLDHGPTGPADKGYFKTMDLD